MWDKEVRYSAISHNIHTNCYNCIVTGPPALLHDNNYQQMGAVGANCQVVQVVSNAVLPAMVTGYPMPAVMWFKDVRRTNRITNDSIYQLLPTGDVSNNNFTILRMYEW